MSKTFDNWNCIDPIPLGFLDRRIFTGEKVMLVHNVIHPNEVIPHTAILMSRYSMSSPASAMSPRRERPSI